MTSSCIGPTHYPDDRPADRCRCERLGLRPHTCELGRTHYLLRPIAKPVVMEEDRLTYTWTGGNLPLCSPCAAQYTEHGYQGIIKLEEATNGIDTNVR
mgnify:CR=1 FL=1